MTTFPSTTESGTAVTLGANLARRNTTPLTNLATKDRFRDARSEARKRAVAGAKEAVCAYLREHPCVDCGETDIVVLDFDHRNDKEFEISKMVCNGAPWTRILTEIQKCEVVCANDHRRRTARTFGWQYRLAVMTSSAASMTGDAPDS